MVAYWYVAAAAAAHARRGLRIRSHQPARPHRFDGSSCAAALGTILRKIILSRFANTFALLYASGIPILESIRTTQDVVGNLVIRRGWSASNN
jgi:type IV pilus assembly protein PilC